MVIPPKWVITIIRLFVWFRSSQRRNMYLVQTVTQTHEVSRSHTPVLHISKDHSIASYSLAFGLDERPNWKKKHATEKALNVDYNGYDHLPLRSDHYTCACIVYYWLLFVYMYSFRSFFFFFCFKHGPYVCCANF